MNPALAEFEEYLHSSGEVEPEEAGDPFAKFRDDAALAGAFGKNGHEQVARLHESTSKFNTRTVSKNRDSADSWETEIPSSAPLHKRASAAQGARLEKSANGKWSLEYDAAGELVGGQEIES